MFDGVIIEFTIKSVDGGCLIFGLLFTLVFCVIILLIINLNFVIIYYETKSYIKREMSYMGNRIYRSNSDKILGGVCAGLAEYLDIDPTIIRIIWAVSFFQDSVF